MSQKHLHSGVNSCICHHLTFTFSAHRYFSCDLKIEILLTYYTNSSLCLFYLDDLEAEMPLVQHDDLILVRAIIDHVSQSEQRVTAG